MKNILNQKFDDFEDEPDRDVWAAIETELRPKQAGIFAYRKYVWAMAASVAMFLGIGYYFSADKKEHLSTETVSNEAKTPEKEAVITQEPAQITHSTVSQNDSSVSVHTVASQMASPTKATQSIKKIKTADGRTLIEKTETYIVKETKTYEVVPETKQEIQVAQSMEKQPVQAPTIVTPSEIKPAIANGEPTIAKSEPWKVYTLPAQNTAKPETKAKPVTKNKGQNTQLDLNHTNPVQLASFASQQLNKVANTPVKVNYQEDKKTNKVRYEIGFKDFKIVRKTNK